MTRRTLTAALIAGALLTPQGGEAQHDPTRQPLRSLCLSHAMEYCLNIFTWDWQYSSPSASGRGSVLFTSELEFSGSGLSGSPVGIGFDIGNTGAGGDDYWVSGFVNAGMYTWSERSVANLSEGTPTVADIVHMRVGLGVGPFAGTCSAGGVYNGASAPFGGAPCHEVSVPEPGTWLLLLTGMFGLGLVGWRCREEQSA